MKYQNLKRKTVFDFCKDARLLEEVTGCTSREEFVKDLPGTERARSFLDLAERTKNKELEAAVRRVFKEELNEYLDSFNE